AEPAEAPRPRPGDRRAEGRRRQARALCQPLQHHVLDRHALLHGDAPVPAGLIVRPSDATRGPAGPRFVERDVAFRRSALGGSPSESTRLWTGWMPMAQGFWAR